MQPLRRLLLPCGERTGRTAAARKRWRDARAFQADVQVTLSELRVQFMEWLLLETVCELCDETGDAVSQNMVAERAGLTRQVASYWLIVMSEASSSIADLPPWAWLGA